MLILELLGSVVLALLTTLAFGYVFLYFLSKSLDWLYMHYGTTITRLRKQSPQEGNSDSRQEGQEAEYLIYSHYLSQNARRLLKWIRNIPHVHTQRPNKDCKKKCPETRPKGFVPRRPFPSWGVFSQWHIRNM
jgi:hypothetical protein